MEDFSIFLPEKCNGTRNPTTMKGENFSAGLNSRLLYDPSHFGYLFVESWTFSHLLMSRITYLKHHEPCPWNEAGAFQAPHGAQVLRIEGCRSRRSPARRGRGSKLRPPIPTRQMQRASSIVPAQLLLLLDGIHSATMSLSIMKSSTANKKTTKYFISFQF